MNLPWSMTGLDVTRDRRDRHIVEWLLFLLLFIISFRTAWFIHDWRLDEFFKHAADGLGYYQWLPAAFIDHDFNKMYWAHTIAEDRAISMFSLGVAVLQLPFFLLGHFFAWFFDYEQTGFTQPYAIAMMASTATYTGLGGVVTYWLARRFSTIPAALLAVITIYAGTNLFWYATDQALMSHAYSFFLVAVFCWTGLRIIDGPTPAHVALFLFSGMLMLLVRQLLVVVLIFPLWMAFASPGGLRGAWRNLSGERSVMVAGILLGLIPWILQAIYWHHITGHWYANGYAYKDEHFDFTKMVPGLVLFRPRNGWFVYSPIFLIFVTTLVMRAWKGTRGARPVLLITLTLVLLYSAWWCWWLGGSYGYRGMVDIYALLAIPAAWFFRSVMGKQWTTRVVVGLTVWLLISLNFGMMEHFDWSIYCEENSWPRFWEVVGNIAAEK